MSEEAHASSAKAEATMPNKVGVMIASQSGDGEILINGSPHLQSQEGNKEDYEEETASDGEFIKVEKELIDVKESSQSLKSVAEVEESAHAKDTVSSKSVDIVDKVEVEDKVKNLELQLGTISKELEHSESEKALLQTQADHASKRLEEMTKRGEALELERNMMREQCLEAERKHNMQLESLQEALGALEEKQRELIDVKEAFSGLSGKLESSMKTMEDLEQQLASSAGEARKFEALSNERGSHAESESKKAVEFEKMLEVAKMNAKEMENQMGTLQAELRGLYDKIAENHRVEEALSATALELSNVQENLELSKSQIADLEKRLSSGEAVIQELNQELNLQKVSEEQMRKDVQSLENLLSASKEDLQTKLTQLEELELKVKEEVKTREAIEASLNSKEMQTLSLQEELVKLAGEKEALEGIVTDLRTNLSLSKELSSELEEKLNLADHDFSKTNSLLSQALAYQGELDQKLKSLEDLLHESRTASETASQKNFELEEIIQKSSVTEDAMNAQLREAETKLTSVEKRNMELEQQLNLAELKFHDADKEIKELNAKVKELSTSLKEAEEASALSSCHFQANEERIIDLELALSKTSSRNKELEQELESLAKQVSEHEVRASATQQRSLELEDLVQISHSKAESVGKKVGELELLLEAANYRTLELEQLLSSMEAKCRDAESESKQHGGRVSELSTELEAFQAKSASLEQVLKAANEKERALLEMLKQSSEEQKRFEGLSNSTSEKLLQAENLIEALQSELKSAQEKLADADKDLEASGIRETELIGQLKAAEEQLEHHGKTIEHVTSKKLELESLHESLAKDSELKVQEALIAISQKDSEAQLLHEKSKSLEERLAFYQDQAIEATERAASLKEELEASTNQLISVESMLEDLKKMVSETELKADQSTSENELLAETNSKLKEELEGHQHKLNELHQLLSSIQAEKEESAEQLALHVKTIADLTDEHSRGLELHSTAELCLKETELQLHDAVDRVTQRDCEVRDLNEKLQTLETQLRIYQEQVESAGAIAETRKVELEEAMLKLQNLEEFIEEMQTRNKQFDAECEGLVRANLNLTQELAAYELKMNELQMTLNAVIGEKDCMSAELHSSSRTIEELTEQLASDREKLQSQISSIMEENSLLNETYEDAKREHRALVVQMEEQLNDKKAKEICLQAEAENLKTQLAEKSPLQARISELEQQAFLAETKFKEETESIQATIAEKEVVFSSKLEEHASTLHDRDVLGAELRELQKELDLARRTIAAQDESDSRKELGMEAAKEKLLGELAAEHQRTVLLEKKVEELKQKLEIAEAKYSDKEIEEGQKLALVNAELDNLKHKLSQSGELETKVAELEKKLMTATRSGEEVKDGIIEMHSKDGMELRSRDLGLDTATTVKRRGKKRGEEPHTDTTVSKPTTPTAVEHSPAMAFKFILGVALVSLIFGIILGKRY